MDACEIIIMRCSAGGVSHPTSKEVREMGRCQQSSDGDLRWQSICLTYDKITEYPGSDF